MWSAVHGVEFENAVNLVLKTQWNLITVKGSNPFINPVEGDLDIAANCLINAGHVL